MKTKYERENDKHLRYVFQSYYQAKVVNDKIYRTLTFEEKLILLRQANGKDQKTGKPEQVRSGDKENDQG